MVHHHQTTIWEYILFFFFFQASNSQKHKSYWDLLNSISQFVWLGLGSFLMMGLQDGVTVTSRKMELWDPENCSGKFGNPINFPSITGFPFHPTYNDRYKGIHRNVENGNFDPIWNMKSLDIFLFHYRKRGMKHKDMAAITDRSTCWFCLPKAGTFSLHTIQGTKISLNKVLLKMVFLFPRWERWFPWMGSLY